MNKQLIFLNSLILILTTFDPVFGDHGCGLPGNYCNYECFRYCITAGPPNYGSGSCYGAKCVCSWDIINETLNAMQTNPNFNNNLNPNLNPNPILNPNIHGNQNTNFNPNQNPGFNPNRNPINTNSRPNNNFNTNSNPNAFNNIPNNNPDNFNRNNNPNLRAGLGSER